MDNNPVAGNSGNDPKKPQTNFFEDILFSIVAGVALLFWDLTTKRLLVGTYRDVTGEGEYKHSEANVLNHVIGTLLSLVAGIAVGYNMWWVGAAPFLHWAPWAVGSAAVMAVYVWPAIYMLAIKRAFIWSGKLWSYVNIDAQRYSRSRSGVNNPAWFSRLLMGVSTAAVVVLSLRVVYIVACYVQAHQGGWGWLGWIIGMVAAVVAVIVAIALVIATAFHLRSGKAAFFLALVMAGLSWYFWAAVSGLFLGLYHNLTGGDWGSWGYVPGGLVGLIAGALVGAGVGAVLWNLRMRFVAAVTSVAAVYFLSVRTDALVGQIPLGPFGVIEPVMPWLAYALELLVFAGFAFPILHIVISHGLRKLADIFEMCEEVYRERRGGYREFFLQVLNLGGVGAVVWFGPALTTTVLGFTALYAVWPITIAAALFTYIVLGKVLDRTGVWPLGLAVSGYTAVQAFAYYHSHFTFGGWIGAAVVGAISGLATMVVAFPGIYLIIRWVLDRSWLAGLVRDGLVNAHHKVCTGIETLISELLEASAKTYGDRTPYREVGIHVTNIVVALAVLSGTLIGGHLLDVAMWLTALSAVIATMASYGVVGKVLLRWGMKPLGYLVGGICGILFGVFVHGAQPEAWGYYRYILSVLGGLFGAAFTHGVLFPWVYLLIRFVVNLTSPETWLRPGLIRMHEQYTRYFGQFGQKFMVKYRLFQAKLAAARERFAERYTAFQQRFNDRNKK